MFPYVRILGVDLYEICIMLGIILAFISYRVVSDKIGIENKLYNSCLILGALSTALGFIFASVIQSLYNFVEYKKFEWGGMTFLGGLLCSAMFFIIIFFILQKYVYKNSNGLESFRKIAICIIPSIVIAHSIGRIGCLCAGCCYGIKTDFLGVKILVDGVYEKRLPTQLFESAFLLCLYIAMIYLIFKRKTDKIPEIYLTSYGIWRFIIEFFRGDDRGSIGLSFITPSQLISVVMIILGVVLIVLNRRKRFIKVNYQNK